MIVTTPPFGARPAPRRLIKGMGTRLRVTARIQTGIKGSRPRAPVAAGLPLPEAAALSNRAIDGK